MLTDIVTRIFIGIGVAVLTGIFASLLRIKYRLLIAVICFILAIILSFVFKPLGSTVPDVIGYFETDARRIIQESGLVSDVTSQPSPLENEHKVIRQNPKGGVRVKRDSTVILIIGNGNGNKIIPPPEPPVVTDNAIMINFIRPQQGDYVPQFTDIEYQVDGSIPSGYRDVLFVQDPLGQYWSWETPIGYIQHGVQFGVAEDSGRQFKIVVLITDREIRLGTPYQSLPQGIYHSSITVTRR